MFASTSGARRREGKDKTRRLVPLPGDNSPKPILATGQVNAAGTAGFSRVDLGDSLRMLFMFTPQSRGSVQQQTEEALQALASALSRQSHPMSVVSQTVFLRSASDQAQCERIFSAHFGSQKPVTNFVLQPPCCGAALALEAWAVGGPGVAIERFGHHALSMSYDGLRWVHCAGIAAPEESSGVYAQTIGVMNRMKDVLTQAGTGFDQVVRTWYYLGDITGPENGTQRYLELNRARTDFYRNIRFGCSADTPAIPQGIYPASTGIGMTGPGLVASCVALQTRRKDALLLPLENPQQTPAYAYPPRHSPKSPKFSRAKALVLDGYVTTWISGTASVVHSNSRYVGDLEKQTQQTLDNIERLIAQDNFAFHGVRGAGATLQDMAKVRVYLKRSKDFAKCKAICQQRLGDLPAIYAIADICRPELLVEIEGVAFSKSSRPIPSIA